ncbi:hypothetical protein [Prevotella pallens]|nr:hypothetical protein [Prevotella pallens]
MNNNIQQTHHKVYLLHNISEHTVDVGQIYLARTSFINPTNTPQGSFIA